MIKALIIDDEKDAVEALQALLQEYCPEVAVIAQARSALEGVRVVNTHNPDLVFLDVEMPGGGGFDFLEALPERRFRVIFTTAYNQYAIKAIRAGAFDYLLKPVVPDELVAAVKKISVIKERAGDKGNKPYKVTFSDRDAIVVVTADDIIHIKANDRYSTAFLVNGNSHTVSRNIKEFEDELASYRFFRVHKSHLVNCLHVKQITRIDGGFIELSNGTQIEISRRKRSDFLRFLKG